MEMTASITERITFKTIEGYVFVNFCEIVHIEARRNHIALFINNQPEPLQVLLCMQDVEKKLEKNPVFFKCHRSHLVNLLYVQEFKEKDRILVTQHGEIPISEQYIKCFKDTYCKDN